MVSLRLETSSAAAVVKGFLHNAPARLASDPDCWPSRWRSGCSSPLAVLIDGRAREEAVKVLFCHPSGLMYTEIFLRLEPLGLETVAAATRQAGHQVRILDLQVFTHADYFALLDEWRPDAVAFGVNYLANIPEVIDLAKLTRRSLPDALIIVGGHSASFTAGEILEHAAGAIDCVV